MEEQGQKQPENFKERISHITIRDVAAILLCAITVYLVRVKDSYLLKPVWRHDFETKTSSSEDGEKQKLPPPIITDIESDGINEVIFITNDFKLMMLAQPGRVDSQVLPHMNVKYQTQLPLNVSEDGRRSHPVAMATGYLDSYQSIVQVRKQVICVVTDDWRVLLYDHQMALLWQTQLMNMGHVRDNYYVKAMAVLVSANSIKRDDRGTIMVGGSHGHRAHHQKKWSDISAEQGRHDDSRHIGEDSFTHFSTIGLGGSDGSTRWHHLPGDFGEEHDDSQSLWQGHHWKLNLKKKNMHAGESHWSKYHYDILSQLPHSWSGLSSTSIQLAQFKKTGQKPVDTVEDVTPTLSDIFGADHIMGFQYGGLRPHSKEEHVINPNAVVIQNHNGLEVLNLQSGQPMTRINLPDENTLYVDINGDKNINQIKTTFSRPDSDLHECNAIVSSVPSNKILFTGPICETPSVMGVLSHKGGETVFYDYTVAEDVRLAVPPIIAKSLGKKGGILNHLRGYNLAKKKGYDSIYYTSHGKLTSYGPGGEFHWQVALPTKWAHITHVVDDSIYEDSVMADIYQHEFKPTMKTMSYYIYGSQDMVVTSGWGTVALTDLSDGRLLAEHSLPCKPSDAMVTGDFSNDGKTDIIITCARGYLGFSVETESNIIYTVLFGMLALLVAFFLTWLCQPNHIHTIMDGD